MANLWSIFALTPTQSTIFWLLVGRFSSECMDFLWAVTRAKRHCHDVMCTANRGVMRQEALKTQHLNAGRNIQQTTYELQVSIYITGLSKFPPFHLL